ncbi:monovalent cation/H+ antiporter subunit D [Ruixingdingia sedimenti]|uniref:Monovalent cation/H+ antiporter subunit D n=1 Tax=Ruixingdingia sedimenti TaxID=3073604 RepID=A0ABU1F8T2_9RHOB|nr:monovalent cation/H+ antiporter subunit D [Xinfangfangia sp. LG-4]MDR5653275.1 monovalent cation/H+ antiporter subunit D [Xinfangfangia sp. LG-4]
MSHWIIAPVVLPAVLGPLIVLLMRNDLTLQRVFSLAGTLALLAISVALLAAASSAGPEVYLLGNWPAPFGIVLVLDRLSALLVLLTAMLAVAVLLYVIGTGWDARGRHFHALFQFQLMGICGAFLTGDAFNLFVFFEVLLIASYGLMIHAGGGARLRAGVQYIAYNLAGSTLFLFALATVYSVTGTLNMADLSVKIAALPEGDAALIRVAGVLFLIVFAVKGALVPMQFWLPNTYALAPGPVAALFAVMTKVGAYAILRFFTLMFGPDVPATGTFYAEILYPAALLTLVVGMVGILGAKGLARLVAFAAIGSMGTLFLGMAPFSPQTTAAVLYYLVHSTLATAALFLIADMVLERRGTDTLAAPRPPIPQNGLIAALFFAGAIAIAGLPPLSGFVGKLLILDALRNTGPYVLAWSAILITSLIAVAGLARAGSLLFWKAYESPPEPVPHDIPPPARALPFVAVGLLLAGLVAMTVLAGPIMGWMEETAAQVHDPRPWIDAHALPQEEE